MPSWLTRWGLTIMLLLFAIIISLGYFITFPKIVYGKISNVTPSISLELISRTDGYFQLVKNRGEFIPSKDIIAFIGKKETFELIVDLEKNILGDKEFSLNRIV